MANHVRACTHMYTCLSSTLMLPFPASFVLIFIAAIVLELVLNTPICLKQCGGKGIPYRQPSRPGSSYIHYNEQLLNHSVPNRECRIHFEDWRDYMGKHLLLPLAFLSLAVIVFRYVMNCEE